MFKHVLVGVDGNDGGRDAIALAQLLRDPDGELSFAHIYPGDAHIWRGTSPPYEAAEAEHCRELLEAERERAGVAAECHWRGASSVGRGLHELAEAVDADLLVIGSCRHSLFGRVMLGDDTRAALNGAPCAVAIAPAGYDREPALMREIGVGYDGSPESEHALAIARRLAVAHGARLSAFQVAGLPAIALGGGPAVLAEIETLVELAKERVGALGGVEPHAAYGQPSEELALYSASLGLLVVGSRSYGPLGRLVHGSTARQLARSARCPLLVLTRGSRRRLTQDEHGSSGAAVMSEA